MLISQLSYSQANLLKETIAKIEFKQDTVKAVYDWVTNNIKYDVNKLNNGTNNQNINQHSKFKSEAEFKAHMLKQVIKKNKGVCQDYSLLFDAILQELGYETFIIKGYTKTKGGKLKYKTGHTWNAAKVNGKWRIYEPTWGAGYIENNSRFVKAYDKGWYDVTPEKMIERHMPFDPVWQLSKKPLNYSEFKYNRESTWETDYNFEKIIDEFMGKVEKDQMQDQVKRSLEMGTGIIITENWRKRLVHNSELYGITSNRALLEKADGMAKNGFSLFNDYMSAKNKQFKGEKWSIESAKEKLNIAKTEFEAALEIYNSIEVENQNAINNLNKSKDNCNRLLTRITEELLFADKLLAN